METTIYALVEKALLESFGVKSIPFTVEHPELDRGDYTTNAALIVAKQLGKNPKEVADTIATTLADIDDRISSIEVAGPGFINFTISRQIFIDGLRDALSQKEKWGNTDVYAGKKIVVEHSSPNLFKPFHVGHLMNNTVGEALTRLARSSGATVVPISFPSDISLGVAKAVYVLLEKYGAEFEPTEVNVLGGAYVEGTKRYEEDESIQSRVKEIADNLYASKDSPELTLYTKCKVLNISYFESILEKLGSHFEEYIYESEAGIEGKKLVLENTPAVFTESEGAVVYIPSEGSKLHTAVFINSQGNPTYEAKDLGLLEMKFTRHTPDISIIVTDNQQVSHFEVVTAAAGKINQVWEKNSIHRSHGRMSFKGKKMSSRLGGVPTVEGIIGAVVEEVKEKNPDVTADVAQMIGIASFKFAILRTMAGKDINFDPETSLSFEGDSGPYLQYTAVRAKALLDKAKGLGINLDATNPVQGSETLERLIARLPEVVAYSQREWAPHHIVIYLLELAQSFNSWYGQAKIIDEDIAATAYRLAVVDATRQTISNGLSLLAMEVPEKM